MEDWTRREFLENTMLASTIAGIHLDADPAAAPGVNTYSLTINGQRKEFSLDPRVTLLDLLRERTHLFGSKKGCDHGQCGACTVIVNGRRELSCLSLAIAHDGDHITTIEGLEHGGELHPMQAAFLDKDGFQCGYCTPGQICSAVAMVEEARAGVPSAVTRDLAKAGPITLTKAEVRERMAGNICRCGAYPNIVAAICAVTGEGGESA